MADWWDYQQRWRRRWQRWRRQADDRREAWRRRWRRHNGNSHDSEGRMRVDVDEVTQEAMGKAVMQQMQAHTLQAIRQAVRAELLEEVKEEALELAKAELQGDFDRRRERLLDDLAHQKSRLEDEALGEVDRQREVLEREVGDAWQEKYLTVRDERDEARGARDQAEAVLVALVRQLLPEGKRVYLHTAGVKELDREALNAVLAGHGLRVRSRATYSERLVTVRLDAARVVGHTQFWLDRPAVAGVAEELEPGEDAAG